MDSPSFQSPSGSPALKLDALPHRSHSLNAEKLQLKLNWLERQKTSTLLSPFQHMASPDITVTYKVPSPTSSSPSSYVAPEFPPHTPHQSKRPQRYSVATSQLLFDQKPRSDMLKHRTYSLKRPSKDKES
jgi:hypothetical protein